MRFSFAIVVGLVGLAFAHPAPEPIEARNDALLAPLVAQLQLEGADNDTINSMIKELKLDEYQPVEERSVGSDIAVPAELQGREAGSALAERDIIDPNCIRCIKRMCTRAARCLAGGNPIACLLLFCAAGSAICCAF